MAHTSKFSCLNVGKDEEPMEGFEPSTCCLRNSHSNHLSYIGRGVLNEYD